MPELVNFHDNFANPTTDILWFGSLLSFISYEFVSIACIGFASHQDLLSYFAFCSIGCFLAGLGIYLVTVSICVDTLVV